MDSLLTLRRPLKNFKKPPSKKLPKSKKRMCQPISKESLIEKPQTSHQPMKECQVSFVSLYNEMCCERSRGSINTSHDFLKRSEKLGLPGPVWSDLSNDPLEEQNCEARPTAYGDAPNVEVVAELDY